MIILIIIILIGFAKWDISKDVVSPAFCGVYDANDNLIAAKYDSTVSIYIFIISISIIIMINSYKFFIFVG